MKSAAFSMRWKGNSHDTASPVCGIRRATRLGAGAFHLATRLHRLGGASLATYHCDCHLFIPGLVVVDRATLAALVECPGHRLVCRRVAVCRAADPQLVQGPTTPNRRRLGTP